MAIQHEITRDILLAVLQQHKITNINEVNDLYKSIYNVVQESTDMNTALYGFHEDEQQD
ncbi:hypothetical protein [Ligilactobacillus acidipiscis]|uniref:hypothetical protein n=1 Tax=Ligilactobacillus acidipiscis TaxID=89059 RepID=UPI0022E01CE3|nr:hypothetical protein [Ligilactobacillus acidipiscis]